MRLTLLLMLGLLSCAHVPAPAARPTSASPQADVDVPLPSHGLDAQGVRELLAGFEYELGDERARTAAEKTRADYAEYDARAMRSYAESMRAQSIWLPVTIGSATFVLGVCGGLVIGISTR